jgi:hypothetical protein
MVAQDMHFDAYTWRARVLPVFLLLLPIGVLLTVWFPGFNSLTRLIAGVTAPFGIAMLFSQIGRDRGSARQPALWASWGGSPTVQLLRHRNELSNPVIRQEYHRKLGLLCPQISIPTVDEELKDERSADQIYEAAVRWLIGRTRDRKRFPLVFKENVSYGFRRNLWGLKPFGIGLAALGVIGCGLRLWVVWGTSDFRKGEFLIGSVVTLAWLMLWVTWITRAWVRVAAEAYAERLLESCDDLLSN